MKNVGLVAVRSTGMVCPDGCCGFEEVTVVAGPPELHGLHASVEVPGTLLEAKRELGAKLRGLGYTGVLTEVA